MVFVEVPAKREIGEEKTLNATAVDYWCVERIGKLPDQDSNLEQTGYT